jgi:hypothetical protein
MGQTMADSINPNGNKSISANLLPRYYRTDANKKFLQATLDQLIQPGTVKKVNGYIGKQNAKSSTGEDIFVAAANQSRQDYQLEPGLTVKDTLGNTTFFKDYQDYINQLEVFGANVKNHARLNEQEFYSWDPHIDWDKFVNFQNYYWLPYGPEVIRISGQQQGITSTFSVSIQAELDNNAYVFSSNINNPSQNPSLKLYRGQTYRFDIVSPGNPFSIKTKRSLGTIDRYDTPGLTGNAVEHGVIELTIPHNSPDILYYVSETDVNLGGVFEILSISENTTFDVAAEIIGKKTYTLPGGIALSNGMKVSFDGQVIPSTYSSGQYYVEGVGNSIQLISESILELVSAYTDSESILFDTTPFDSMPWSDATAFAGVKDYVVINRNSIDHNPWSRYNRWFHKDVVETTATYNGKVSTIDQSARAVRPIIEFEGNLKLYNFGTTATQDIDLIDTYTTDLFSNVEGQLGYNIDGIAVAQGQRILVTADTDIRVKNRIFKVEFLILDGVRQIHLVDQGEPQFNQVVLVKQGLTSQGKMYWYDGTMWNSAQQKLTVNQPPLFDIVNSLGESYGNKDVYDGSTFAGTSLFSYKVGTGTNDSNLGFPLSYKNIANIGDIVFNFNIATDSFQYKSGSGIVSKETSVGYLVKTLSTQETMFVNGWQIATNPLVQAAVRIYKDSNKVNKFDLDVFEDITKLDDLRVKVYINGIRLPSDKWSIIDGPYYKQIALVSDITVTDILTIKAYSSQSINQNGYYEIPVNLQNNPLNSEIGDFTLGEVIDHVNSIVENVSSFSGVFPGAGNLRDLGNVTPFGTRFVQHSGPISLSLYHTASETNNIIRAIEKARDDYNRFKRNFVTLSSSLVLTDDPVSQVNLILQEINKDKPNTFPYYFSDMVPFNGSIKTDLTVVDFRIKTYPLTNTFNLDNLSNQAVLVYLNNEQLLYKKDYTFDDQGFVVVLADIANDDTITIYEFENTNGCFVPATPTKLGIWPKYEPRIYLDTSLVTPRTMIQGHDGSQLLAYGDYRDTLILELEKRIYNNIKIEYNPDIFDIDDLTPSYNRANTYSLSEFNEVLSSNFYKWVNFIDKDFTKPLSYDVNNSLTFNYRELATPDGQTPLPGYWKGIHRWMLGTDRPNICPWEMLGFSEEPAWWQDLYGPAPYTSNNLILWNDISEGLVREPGKPAVQLKKYVRSYLKNRIPVDENGDIVSPLLSGLATGPITNITAGDFIFGDVSPVESAWRRSSHYPFSLLITFMLLQPSKTFGTLLDRSRVIRNLAGQLIYKDTGLRIKPADVLLPSIYSSTTNVKTSGIINYIVDYILSDNLKSYKQYAYDLKNIVPRLSHRIGGFTSKEKFNLLLDSKTPLTSGSVFVPQEDYEIILNSSSPIKKITYSGVIVTKFADGFGVKGYSTTQPYFKYYEFTKSGALINVGGISESYVVWAVRSQFAAGKIVSFSNRFYRVKTLHTTTDLFNPAYYELLPSLPIIGGVDSLIRQAWDKTTPITVPYGTKFRTVQDVVDFLLGYGEWLTDQGFIFDDFNSEISAISNWETSAKEFLFWTTQNWSSGEDKWQEWSRDQPVPGGTIVRFNGDYYQSIRYVEPSPIFEVEDYAKLDGLSTIGSSVISLSPAAAKLTFSTPLCVVDDIRNPFNGYEIFKVDGTQLPPNFLNNFREDNTVSYTPMEDGIYGATFYLVQKEQVVVLKNQTLFNDTIYSPSSGYRQERIKVAGYISSEWKGDFNIPGFIFDRAVVSDWESWKDYALGDIVKYKQFYYASKSFISGAQTFEASDWVKLDKKPEAQLLPNWTYKASQFEDFYSLDSDNFDASQQEVAQHLIGYQKRQYLSNIIQDDVSEFKFYQGMIVEKGTKNVLNKLFDVLSADGKDSITFYEEWALRIGQYGASQAFDAVEFIIDEAEVKNNPQGFELVNQIIPGVSDFISRQTPNDVYLKPVGYKNNPFPLVDTYIPYLRTPGYVRSSDVTLTLKTIDEIFSSDVSTFLDGSYVWVGFEGREWNVYRYTNLNITVKSVEFGTALVITAENNISNISIGDIIGIDQASDYTGFYKVTAVTLRTITAEATFKSQPRPFADVARITVGYLVSQRFSSIDTALPLATNPGEKIWTDNSGDGKWATWQFTPAYTKSEIINTFPQSGLEYGKKILLNTNGTIAVVSAKSGDIIVYDRTSLTAPWLQRQTITAPFISKSVAGYSPTPGELTGEVLAISVDSQWLATGTPLANNVSNKFKGIWSDSTQYSIGNIVLKDGIPYKAVLASLNKIPPDIGVTYSNVTAQTVSGSGNGATFNVSTSGVNYSASVISSGTDYAVGDSLRILGTLVGGTAPTNNITLRVVSIINGAAIGPIATVAVSGNAIVYWSAISYIPVDSTGTNSNLVKQGVISIYKKDANNIFSLFDTILSPQPTSNEQFGSNLVFGDNTLFVTAQGFNDSGCVYRLTYLTSVKAATSYNPIGSAGATIVLSSTDGIELGMYLRGNGFVSNQYVAAINGIDNSIIISAAPDSTPSGIIEFTVTSWTYDLNNSFIDQSLPAGSKFGSALAISADNSTLVISDANNLVDDAGVNLSKVYVYKQQDTSYELFWNYAPGTDPQFGSSLTVSATGDYVAISSIYADLTMLDQGSVAVYKNTNSGYAFYQTLRNTKPETAQFFGTKIAFMNDFETLVVYSQGSDNYSQTSFDMSGPTTFDNNLTKFRDKSEDSGRIDIYDMYNANWIFSESLISDNSSTSGYSSGLAVGEDQILVGAPYAMDQGYISGKVLSYSKLPGMMSWKISHKENARVDLSKIKRAFLYNKVSNKLITYLDVIDSNQGKIPGIADQEIKYKTFYDPATYSSGTAEVNVDDGMAWTKPYVGTLWWDLRTAKFFDSHDESLVYRNSAWNTIFPGASIDVYEWVETKLTPDQWNALADTEEGIVVGVSGTSLYGNTTYSLVRKYDNVSKTFKNTYYYWIKNKKTIPNSTNRQLSAQSVVDLIENPRGYGYRYLALTGSNSFSLVNVKSLLEDKDVVLSIEYWTSPYTDKNIHSEWKIINNSSKTDLPAAIEQKWFDSLCGKDVSGRVVPDTALPAKLKYGVEVRPRQGMFINRFEALKQFIEQTNRVLINELIVENKDISKLNSYESQPSTITGLYDTVIDTDAELRFANIGTYGKPSLSPIIVNGRITGINILERGSGYLVAPYIMITGSGTGAVIRTSIDTRGRIVGVTILNSGYGYDDNTVTTVRNYSVLVYSDAAAGAWSIYAYEPSTEVWSRVQSQSYDVRKYWSYVDWYATGYNEFTAVDHSVNSLIELNSVNSTVGQLVKVRTTSLGTWVLLKKYAESASIDWTQSYQVIARQSGTIQFASDLYDFSDSLYGFDASLYDAGIFDNSAAIELRIILETLKENILIDTLKESFLNLFFSSVRYAYSEQNYIDWIFKTSFVKAHHSVGDLTQKVNYNNDNLENFEDYINEVKPYRTKIREYVSSYSKVDTASLSATDFDIPAVFENGSIVPINTTINNGVIVSDNNKITQYPWKHWYDNLGYTVTSLEIVDGGSGYVTLPTVRFVNNSGQGASARAFITNGKVNRIVLLTPGSGYLSAPQIIIDGGTSTSGVPARAIAIIGNGVVRSNTLKIKFDRVSQKYFITNLQQTEIFTGTGSKLQFPLTWSPDVRIGQSAVLINGVETLRASYKLTKVKSTAKGYTSYSGAITFDVAPASGIEITVTYIKDWSVLTAADRIQHYYDPAVGELGKDLAQLMTGVDYGGVNMHGLNFDIAAGWGSVPYYSDKWDSFDSTFDDYIVTVADNTHEFTLPYVPAAGTEMNVYHSSKNVDTYDTPDGYTTVYNFNINDIYPPVVTVSTTKLLTLSPLAGTDILTMSSVAGIKIGDTVVITPDVEKTIAYNTTVIQIIGTTQVKLDQILFKDIVPGTSAVFSRVLVDPTDCIINPNGTVFLNEPISIGSILDITAFIDPVRIDDPNYNTTGTVKEELVLLEDELTVLVAGYNVLIDQQDTLENSLETLGEQLFTLQSELNSLNIILLGMDIDNPTYPSIVSQINILVNTAIPTVQSYISDVETDLEIVSASIETNVDETSAKAAEVAIAQALYDSLPPIANSSAIMQTVISDGIPDDLVNPTYKTFSIPDTFVVDDGDKFIWRKSSSDGSVKPQEADYDTSLSGGAFLSNALTSATGLAADDIIVDGDGFVTATTSPATEEVVPGQVVDAVAIKVYDRPNSGSANIKVDSYIADGVTTQFKITQQPNSTTAVIVKFTEGQRDIDGVLSSISEIQTVSDDYTIDYSNRTIDFNIAPQQGKLVSIFSFGFNGSNILDLDYFIGDGSTTEFVTKAPWVDDSTFLVYVDGLPAEPGTPALFKTDDSYDSADRFGIFFSVPPKNGSLINYIIVSGNEQTYSITKTERIQGSGTNFYDLQYQVGDSLPLESKMLVRVDQRILKGPNNSFYTITGNKLNYNIDPAKFLPYSVSITDIIVYADGELLKSGVDYVVNLAGITVKINNAIRQTYLNKELVISIRLGQEYFYIPKTATTPARIQFAESYDSDRLIEVISSYKHDILNIQRTAVKTTNDLILTQDTPEFYNYRNLSGGTIKLDRTVIDDNYVWVLKNDVLLTPSVDFKLNEDRQSIKLALYPSPIDEFTIITYGSAVLTNGISYMQFKDMLNRTHYKRLNADKRTKLVNNLNFNDTVIEVEDASNFDTPSISNNKPGIIEIRGERIEFFTLVSNTTGSGLGAVTTWTLGQLRRGTLGTGVSRLHKEGSYVQDIGASETIPYIETSTIEQITSDGTNVIPLTFVPTKAETLWNYATGFESSIPLGYGQSNDIEVFVGGYASVPWAPTASYVVDDIVEVGSYTYRCVTAHTSSAIFTTDSDKWTFFIGNIRLKKHPYQVHDVNVHPESSEGNVQLDAEFAVDGVSKELRLTHKLAFGTRVTVVKRTLVPWDSTTNILEDDSKIARFLKAAPAVWYSNIGKYENKIGTPVSFDSTNGTYDSTSITYDQG